MRNLHILLALKALFLIGLLFAQTAAYAHIAEYHNEGPQTHDHAHDHAHHAPSNEHDEHDAVECDIQLLATEDQYILPAPPADLRKCDAPSQAALIANYEPLHLQPPARAPPVRGPPVSLQ